MAELEPAILAERLLRLRRTHPFDTFSTGDLSVLAAAGREVTCSGRTLLAAEGERASAHWVALTGRLRAFRGGEPLLGEPFEAGFGVLSVVAERPLPCELVAEPGTVLFVLDADALFETLEERGRLARAVLREMARSFVAMRHGGAKGEPSALTVVPGPSRGPLDLVARMLVLRSAMGLRLRNAAVLTRLARASRVEHLAKGRSLWPDARVPADLVVVVEGALDHRPDDAESPADGGAAVYGLIEALATLPPERQVLTTAECTALVVSHNEIQEALEDDDRICQELIRLAALELWNAFWKRHPIRGS